MIKLTGRNYVRELVRNQDNCDFIAAVKKLL